MRYQRFVWSLLAAVALLSFGTPKACAQRFFVFPSYSTGPFMSGPLTQPYTPYASYYYTYPAAPSYMPYVAPYPAYGILPPPFVTAHYYEAREQATTGKTADDYGYKLDSPPRMRNSLYPAVPFEKSPEDRLAELRRVHYEIEVPHADAVVYIDGAKTKQKGVKREFVTPPMAEDRYYTATVKAEWVDQFQKTRTREHTFEFVAGQKLRYQFKE